MHNCVNSYLNNFMLQNIIKMFLIKFQEYFKNMFSCSGALRN